MLDPELREGRGEVEPALKGKLPKLVTDDDLRGILHCHTDASDGTETLETMEGDAPERLRVFRGGRPFQVRALCRRSVVEEIAQQHREADRLNKRFGKDFLILKGIESDILAEGRSTTTTRCLNVSTSSSPASMAVSSWKARRRRSACFEPFPILTPPSSAT